MAWDNVISRGIWLMLQPSNLLVLLLLISLISLKFANHLSRGKSLARKAMTTSVVALTICGFTNLSSWLLWPLEGRFDQYRNQTSGLYSGVIVLAGSEQTSISTKVKKVTLTAAGERLVEAAALARVFPDLPVIHSGRGSVKNGEWTENDVARMFFQNAGIDLNRIRFERKSYNTATNATETAKLISDTETAPWLLVTSAFHMPRSVATFERAGVSIQPYPVDYMTSLEYDGIFTMDVADNLKRLDWAIHEYIGLIAYYITGRSSGLFPTPEQI